MESQKDKLLAKWLNETLSTQELNLLKQDYDLEELAIVLSKQQEYDFELQGSSKMWDNLQEKLTIQSSEKVVQKHNETSFPIRRVLLIALVGGLVAVALTLWMNKTGNTISSPQGETVQQLIADNTEFILSPGSSIDYDESNWALKRQVNLVGHAFFNVKKGAEFIVQTESGTVKVLGTQFEVWENKGSMKVNCIEGRVEVLTVRGQAQIISQRESVYINQGLMGQISTHSLEKAEFLSGRYNYEKISIVSLAKELERYYNLEVNIDQIEADTFFSGVLILDDIDKACSYIAETLNLKYERMSSGVTFSQF